MHDRTIPVYDADFRWERLGRRRALRRAGINPETGKVQPVGSLATEPKKKPVSATGTKPRRDPILGL